MHNQAPQQPKQYQQGWTEFYKLKFCLTKDVLIPRPETELLVDAVLNLVGSWPSALRPLRLEEELGVGGLKKINPRTLNPNPLTILDVGTGSGCIAISIAKNLPHAKIFALDISPKALEIAEKNAKLHNAEDKVFFIKSNLLSGLHLRGETVAAPADKIDIIVANLPYIPTARLLYVVDPMVKDFEPRLALDGGKDGFELYRQLFKQMRDANFYPKWLIAEIDEKQGEIALAEAKKYFPKAQIEVKKDLAKKNRILIIKF